MPPIAATPTPFPRLWPGPTLYGAQSHVRRLNVPYLRRIADAGFDAVRLSLVPWWARSRHGGWMWTNYDAIYAWLVRRGITPLFQLENPRTQGDVPATIYFARTAAARYPRALLELGNEPDNPQEWPGFYARRRATLTPEAYWRIERQFAVAWHEGNPRARIATGGTSGIDLPWQRRLIGAIEADGAFADGTIEAVAVHAYGERPQPMGGRDIGSELETLKAMLPPGVQVWVTEYGLLDPRPQDVSEWFSAMSALGVPVFSWYEAQDDVLDGRVQRYGLVRLDGSARPAYEAARSFLLARPERSFAAPGGAG